MFYSADILKNSSLRDNFSDSSKGLLLKEEPGYIRVYVTDTREAAKDNWWLKKTRHLKLNLAFLCKKNLGSFKSLPWYVPQPSEVSIWYFPILSLLRVYGGGLAAVADGLIAGILCPSVVHQDSLLGWGWGL